MKSLINRYVSLFLLLTIIAVTVSGCFNGGSGSSDNPVASAVTQTKAESPVRAGTATVSFVIVMPDGTNSGAVRASTLSTSLTIPYASATLLVNGTINQRKEAPVVNGAVTLTFTGVPDSGNAELYLDLLGCSYNGVANFYGTTTLTSGNNVVTLSPRIVPGSNKTSDGKLLVELSNNFHSDLTFTEQQQPVGFSYDNYVMNFETGQKYFYTPDIGLQEPKFKRNEIAWFNGKVWLGGLESFTEVDPTTGAFILHGDPTVAVPTKDGDTLETARYRGLGMMQTVGSVLHIKTDLHTLMEFDGSKFKVYDIPVSTCDRLSVLEDGTKLVSYVWDGDIPTAARFNGSSKVETYYLPEKQAMLSAIDYNGGILFAATKAIYYYKNGSWSTWLTPESVGAKDDATFGVYKNSNGAIYVTAERVKKIWRVE